MARGFMASGSSRTSSTCSKPFSRPAPFTTTWSASSEFPLETAGGDAAMEEGALLLLALLLAANGERVLLRLEVQVVRAEPRDRHADAVRVLVDKLDIVGRIARRIVVERAECVEQRAETVEADGGSVKRSKIEVYHDTSSLKRC